MSHLNLSDVKPYANRMEKAEQELDSTNSMIERDGKLYKKIDLAESYPVSEFTTKNPDFLKLRKTALVSAHTVTESDLDEGKEYKTIVSGQDKLENKAYVGDIILTNSDKNGQPLEDPYIYGNQQTPQERAAAFHEAYEKVNRDDLPKGEFYRRKQEISAVRVHENIAFYVKDWDQWFFVEAGGVVTPEYGINLSSLEKGYEEIPKPSLKVKIIQVFRSALKK